MKKLFVLATVVLMAVLMTVPAAASDAPYYFFAEVEDAVLTGDMAVIDWQGASGGKAVVSATAGYTANNFSVDADIPADGTYSIWIRAWVKSSHQCTFQFTNDFGSIARGRIFKMAGNADGSASYVWFPLDARAGVNNDPDVTQNIALTAGTVTFGLGTRSIANVADENRGGAKTTHYLDCVLITDDTDFNPNTGDWVKIRDNLLDPPSGDSNGDQNPPDNPPPSPPTGSALLRVAILTAVSAVLISGFRKKDN